ncbi:MAG TPA: NADH-quinone oxidoreductase subunit L [Gemmatimonadaceae bacterium]|nr:NADH-quinone oxidoreductase subunit L [Gemmatimonadaceae bacterium]
MLQNELPVTGHPLADTVARFTWLLPVLPLLGFLVNGALSLRHAHGPSHDAAHDAHGDAHHPPRHPAAAIASLVGPGVMVLAFGLAVAIFVAMLGAGTAMHEPYIQTLFSWMAAGDLNIDIAFQLDQLSMVMVLIITGVGMLIHVFSVGYMQEDPGYARYFAYLNLFVFFMLLLVLGASYPMMFIGWEGVGLCSYLLIGFWFSSKENADAGKKAFVVNRIGDVGFLIAMFMMFANFDTMTFTGVEAAAAGLTTGSVVATAICLFLFLGAAGKSAQIPLFVWLPDAMAGPTPVSALIHAATMVTGGVYLVARSATLFSMAPVAQLTVAVIGAATAVFAATIGLKQWDIKKVLAYSTVSQLGYMFVAVGVGAYTAGVFHLMTHAFFKALLFLGAGSVIHIMHRAYHATHSHEDAQDMRNMGGMRRHMPVTWVLMWIATLAIAGVPLFSGFFSKDEILASVFARTHGSTLADASWLGIPGSAVLYAVYAMGLAAALLTAIYMTRMMLYTFHGPNRTGETEQSHMGEAPWLMTGPLVVLGILAAVGGWLNLPPILEGKLGPTEVLHHWLEPVVGEGTLAVTHGAAPHLSHQTEYVLIGAAVLIAVAGIVFAIVRLRPSKLVPARDAVPEQGIARVLADKWYVDEAYDKVVVRPTMDASRKVLWRGVDVGLIDGLFVNGSAFLARSVGWVGSQIQTGRVGTYAWVLVLGAVGVLSVFSFR